MNTIKERVNNIIQERIKNNQELSFLKTFNFLTKKDIEVIFKNINNEEFVKCLEELNETEVILQYAENFLLEVSNRIAHSIVHSMLEKNN